MTRLATDEFAAFMGLDWADAKPDICLQAAGSDKREVQVLEHRPAVIEAWAQLVEYRRRLVGDRVRITNRLTRTLKNDFPQVLQWFPNKETLLCCNFIGQWPTLNSAQLARRSTLERFFRQHHLRGAQRIHERLEAIKDATPLTTDEGGIIPHALMVQSLVTQLRATLEAIETFDDAIAQRAQTHPDFALFDALPGAGPVLAPRLLVAFGEQRERYRSAAELPK